MEIYLYGNCTSCKKAEQALKSSGKPYARRDFFMERLTVDELQSLLDRAGLSVQDALSKRSSAFKTLGLADRVLTDEQLLDLMVDEPRLLRRPVILGDGPSVVGFNSTEIAALIDRS